MHEAQRRMQILLRLPAGRDVRHGRGRLRLPQDRELRPARQKEAGRELEAAVGQSHLYLLHLRLSAERRRPMAAGLLGYDPPQAGLLLLFLHQAHRPSV